MGRERFDKTVDILVKAYFDGTLVHTNCFACAVGNIVAHYRGLQFKTDGVLTWSDDSLPRWHEGILDGKASTSEGELERRLTGYTDAEILSIEHAFERWDRTPNLFQEATIVSLMAVVDILAEIDGISLEETETARKLFVKC